MNDESSHLDRFHQPTEDFFPQVYDELRRLAARRLAHEPAGQTLQATALVHEAYFRLQSNQVEGSQWQNDAHFFAAAAEAMRRILVDAARRKQTLKRGGSVQREPLADDMLELPCDEGELLEVHEVLDKLAAQDPLAAQLVKCRFFIGMSTAETADALGISVRSAHNVWTFARAWLRQELRPD